MPLSSSPPICWPHEPLGHGKSSQHTALEASCQPPSGTFLASLPSCVCWLPGCSCLLTLLPLSDLSGSSPLSWVSPSASLSHPWALSQSAFTSTVPHPWGVHVLLDQKQGHVFRSMMVTKCDECSERNSAGLGSGMGWEHREGF